MDSEKHLRRIHFTNVLFNFKYLPVSHLSKSVLPFRERFTRVPSVYISKILSRRATMNTKNGAQKIYALHLVFSTHNYKMDNRLLCTPGHTDTASYRGIVDACTIDPQCLKRKEQER